MYPFAAYLRLSGNPLDSQLAQVAEMHADVITSNIVALVEGYGKYCLFYTDFLKAETNSPLRSVA